MGEGGFEGLFVAEGLDGVELGGFEGGDEAGEDADQDAAGEGGEHGFGGEMGVGIDDHVSQSPLSSASISIMRIGTESRQRLRGASASLTALAIQAGAPR